MSIINHFLVGVKCSTFNHAEYIEDALNGFCIQHTSFPFVCIVIDDASTDGEQEIINEYINENFDIDDISNSYSEETDDYCLMFARHKNNYNCYFAVYFLKYNHYSIQKDKTPYISKWLKQAKYHSYCEGDDYWVDSLKLEKQVNLMEKYPSMSMCFTANLRKSTNEVLIENRMLKCDSLSCSFEDYIVSENDNIDTCTMMYRSSLLMVLPDWFYQVGIGDIPVKLILFSKGSVGYINEITGCYRLNTSSSWSVRMKKSFKMRRKNLRRILKMWKDFDDWTDKKYHRAINKKLFILRKRYLKREVLSLIFSVKTIFTDNSGV